MGVVYKAQDPAIGRVIAIKSIRLNDLTDEKERTRLRDRLYREAQSAGILSHPGIVTIYDYAEENGLAYIFMELVNGPPLEHLLASSSPPDRAMLLGYLKQTAAALDYAHRKGIVHRDIKPSNILIHEQTTAKITDFGIAKIASQHLTQAGAIMGTPSYMSPEQVEGKTVDGRADQYSLAVLAYEMLTGEKPFTAENLPTLLLKIVRDEAPPATRINLSLSSRVDAVLGRAMAKNPENRYATCSDFLNELTEALEGAPAWTPRPHSGPQHLPAVGTDSTADAAPPPTARFLPENYQGRPIPHARPKKTSLAKNVLLATATALGLIGAAALVLRYEQGPSLLPPPPGNSSTDAAKPEPPQQDTASVPPPAPAAPAPVSAPAQPEPKPTAVPVAAGKEPDDLPPEGSFVLTATPAGALAVFDQKSSTECKTPCTLTLPAGRHSVALRADGYRMALRTFNVPQDSGLIVNLEKAEGTLVLASDPPGLTVILDGREQARRTTATFVLPAGPHKVELLNGQERREMSVEIRDGVTTAQTVKW